MQQKYAPLLVAAVSLVVLRFALPAVGLTLTTATDVVIFAIACMALNILVGTTGLVSFGHGAFYGLAAYAAALSQRHWFPGEIVVPTLRAMKAMGAPYKGVLFAGLMITAQGPKLIEYNVRFGDPECQVLMLRLMSDLVPALLASRDGQLKSFDLRWYKDAALTVVMATNGYPGSYGKGSVIEGLDEAAALPDVQIFHAGTRAEGGRVLANGGRVLNVCGTGPTVAQAQARAYAAVDKVRWPDGFCRRDIGYLAIARETSAR